MKAGANSQKTVHQIRSMTKHVQDAWAHELVISIAHAILQPVYIRTESQIRVTKSVISTTVRTNAMGKPPKRIMCVSSG